MTDNFTSSCYFPCINLITVLIYTCGWESRLPAQWFPRLAQQGSKPTEVRPY